MLTSVLSKSEKQSKKKLTMQNLKKIVELGRSLDDIVASYDLSDDNIQHLEAGILVDRVSGDVREAIDAIKKEDDSRELYTLDIAKTDPIKMPVFEGRDDEDFAIFKEKVIKAFAQNRICKDDKVAKLREALRGHAKNLIPES